MVDFYSVIKKNEIVSFVATRIDLEMITLSLKEKDDITSLCNLKYDTNRLYDKAETDPQIERRGCGCQGGGGRIDWEFKISRCKRLHVQWVNNKVLLRSTGNYIQYPVKNTMEKKKK